MTTDPLALVERARDQRRILRVNLPDGDSVDYAPMHGVLNSPKWTALVGGVDYSSVVHESTVLSNAYNREGDVEVLNRADSHYAPENTP